MTNNNYINQAGQRRVLQLVLNRVT